MEIGWVEGRVVTAYTVEGEEVEQVWVITTSKV